MESQSKEIAVLRRHVQEWENRNNECSKKWGQLLNENLAKEEKARGYKL